MQNPHIANFQETFLHSRGHDRPTGEALYSYRMTREEFSELERGLKEFLSHNLKYERLGQIVKNKTWLPALFVLYSSEWWRREYDGSGWSWEPILKRLGAPAQGWTLSQRSECVVAGLGKWRIGLSQSRGFRFLGSIALQGGLPMKLLAAAQGNIGKVLSRVLSLAATSHVGEPEIEEWIRSLSDYLPHTYRQTEIFRLLTQVITTVLSLRVKAGMTSADGVIAKLDSIDPEWRHRFPLSVEDDQARDLIEQLVRDAANARIQRLPTVAAVERTLEAVGDGWQLRSHVVLPEYFEIGALNALFGNSKEAALPRSFILRFGNGEHAIDMAARRLPGRDTYRIDRRLPVFSDAGAAAEQVIAMMLPDGSTRTATLKDELDPELPWLFEDVEGRSPRYVRQGSGSISSPQGVICVSPEWTLEASDDGEIGVPEAIQGLARTLWRFAGLVRVSDSSGVTFKIRSGQAAADDEQIGWIGGRAQAAFGSFTSVPDVTNLGNLNVHLGVPVFSKPGRGIPFSYVLSYDSSVWYPIGVAGAQSWQPVTNWGWRGQTEVETGYISYSQSQIKCYDDPNTPGSFYWGARYRNFVYHDSFGVQHYFPINYTTCSNDPGPSPTRATDGSGLIMDGSAIIMPSGQTIIAPSTPGPANASATDSNGNQITVSGGTFTDTLNTTALTISGGAPSALNFTYKDTTGTPQAVVVNYASFTVQTNFGCGIAQYGPTPQSLISSIVYPNGTQYSFTYESTGAGFGSNVTGRIASVTLPTGGTISYTYTGANNGIICADGSTAGLTRTTTDGVTSYSRTASGTAWTTTITPADNNQTVINFQASGTNFYETQRKSYSGSTTLVGQTDTCYNGAAAPCIGTTITGAIARRTVYPQLANNQQSKVDTYYSGPLPIEIDEYDFGPSAPGSLLRKTLTTYAALGNNIADRPSQIDVYDGANTHVAQTRFNYDGNPLTATSGVPQHVAIAGSRGNLTGVARWLNGGTDPGTTMSYDDTGNVLSTTDPGAHTTSFAYSSTYANAYLTQVTAPATNSGAPANHITSSTYDINTGLKLSDTDENNKVTSYTYDTMLRSSTVNRPDSGTTSFTYYDDLSDPSHPEIAQVDLMSSSTATYSYVSLDGYGRKSRTARYNNEPITNNHDLQDFCYDNMGRIAFVSYPRQGPGFSQAKTCSGAGDTYTYGFNPGTPTAFAKVTHADNSYGWTENYGRAVRVWDEGIGSGQVLRKVSQFDALGNLTDVCEVSNVDTGAGDHFANCGLDMTGNGFKTSYQYDTLGNLTQVNQGSLAPRTFNYDSLSRVISATAPESGTTSFTYDAVGNVLTRTRPTANQPPTGANRTVTTYQYDELNRLRQTSYDDLRTPTVYRYYDEPAIYGVTMQNTIGRLSRTVAGTVNSSFDLYSYDSMGRVITNWQGTPVNNGGGSTVLSYSYDFLGDLIGSNNGHNVTLTNSYNQAGRLTQVTSSQNDGTHPPNLLYAAHYNAFGEMTTNSFGSGVSETDGYTTRGQLQSKLVISPTATVYSLAMTYKPNGNVFTANDNVNGAWSYTYDDFNRLATAAKNTAAPDPAYRYDYDRYGNRWRQTLTRGSGIQPSFGFTGNNNRIDGYCYDPAGNLLNEGSCGTFAYVYDAEGRLQNAAGGNSYIYDAEGRRVRHTQGTTNTDFLYDLSGRMIVVLDGAGAVMRDEIYAGNMHLATYANNTTYFTHSDWLGTTRRQTLPNGGAIDNSSTSGPWGESLSNPSGETAIQFTGDEHDSETGFEHTLFRKYASWQGRWTSPDPLAGNIFNPQSLNRYAYVGNNPIGYVDPSGLCDVFIAGAIQGPGNIPASQSAAAAGAIQAFPYSGLNPAQSVFDIIQQGVDVITPATDVAITAITLAAESPGPINVTTYSGGAQALYSAIRVLPTEISSRIQNINYLSPGTGLGGFLPNGSGTTSVIYANPGLDTLVHAFTPDFNIKNISSYNCPHSGGAGCAFTAAAPLIKQTRGGQCPSTPTVTRGNAGNRGGGGGGGNDFFLRPFPSAGFDPFDLLQLLLGSGGGEIVTHKIVY